VLLVLSTQFAGMLAPAPLHAQQAEPTAEPPVQPAPAIRAFTLGYSAQGRPIEVVQIGTGERKLVIVGDTHGGPEANTHRLTLELMTFFRASPASVPPTVRLYLIPTINPDGLALDSRFDSFGVDLNRNMRNWDTCPGNDWQPEVHGAYGIISRTSGPYGDSQLETRLLRNFLLDASGVIFLHSNAGLVFPALCEHAPSIQMAQTHAAGAGYAYARTWPNYPINGGMHDWAGSLGIAAITPELVTGDQIEFSENLGGVQAVLASWETLLPLPADRSENGFVVPALIWRYWQAHGGAEVFGWPVQPAEMMPDGTVAQTFTNARLVLRPEQADTPFLVEPEPLGHALVTASAAGLPAGVAPVDDIFSSLTLPPATEGLRTLAMPVPAGANSLFLEETGYTLSAGFLDYWRRHGGADVFGYPLSPEVQARAADGQPRTMQYFERAVLAYYPAEGRVRPEPLGWQMLLAAQVQEPWVVPQVR
jgi:predicted deacylase